MLEDSRACSGLALTSDKRNRIYILQVYPQGFKSLYRAALSTFAVTRVVGTFFWEILHSKRIENLYADVYVAYRKK